MLFGQVALLAPGGHYHVHTMDMSSASDVFGVMDSSGAKAGMLTCKTSNRTAQVHIQHLVEHGHLVASEQLILKDTAVGSI